MTFLKIGAFTIGGGYAMLPLIEREVVDRNWMNKEDFMDVFAISQTLPGIFAVNMAVFVGHRIKKLPGAITAAIATVLPSFVIILLIAMFFTKIQDNIWVERAFKGLRPAVVALIAVPAIKMAIKIKLSKYNVWIPIAAALLIWLLGVSPIYVITGAGIIGLAFGNFLRK